MIRYQPAPSPAPPAEEVVDLAAWLRMLWRGRLAMILCSLMLTTLAAGWALRLASPSFEARAVVILESREEKVVDLKDVISGLSGDATVINSEVEVIRARALMARVVADLALVEDPEFNASLRTQSALSAWAGTLADRLRGLAGIAPKPSRVLTRAEQETLTINALLKALTVRNVPDSLVFQVVVETGAAAKSAEIANAIVDTYILQQLEVKSRATEEASAWLFSRVGEMKRELALAEAKVSDYRANADLIEPRALAVLEAEIRDLREAITPQERAASPVARLDAMKPPPLPLGPGRGAVEAALLQARAVPLSPRALRLAELQGALEANARKTSALEQLEREAEASRFLYETFLARMKETSLQLGIQRPDSRILSHAATPLRPSAPNVPRALAVAALFGALIGLGLHILREAGQTAFRAPRELEAATGLRVFGQIPAYRARRLKKIRAHLARNPGSVMAEALRNLRTSLMLGGAGSPPQVIALSSALPGDGKTTLTLTLAQSIAQMGQRVLVIEGDIRQGKVRSYLGQRSAPRGLMAVLSGEAAVSEVVFHSREIGADLLLGERSALNSTDLFSSPAFEALLKGLRKEYDTILIDTPPVLIVPDARIIAKSCDATLFVVKWNSTTETQIEESLQMFHTMGVEVDGLVLNQINLASLREYGIVGGLGTYKHLGRRYYRV